MVMSPFLVSSHCFVSFCVACDCSFLAAFSSPLLLFSSLLFSSLLFASADSIRFDLTSLADHTEIAPPHTRIHQTSKRILRVGLIRFDSIRFDRMSTPSTKKRKMEENANDASHCQSELEPTNESTTADSASCDPSSPMIDDTLMVDSSSASSAAASVESSLSASEVAKLIDQLPQTIDLLTTLAQHTTVLRSRPLHDLRKAVLRLSATLQEAHFAGETKDDAQKRLHRRKEKGQKAAQQLKQKMADEKYINSVALRNARIQALNAMIEPEGWGEKQGDNLLMPGESSNTMLLMPSPSPSSSDDPSASPESSPSEPLSAILPASSTVPSEAARAAAAGPQSYTYPTIIPESSLAEAVGAATTGAAVTTKPYVRPTGGVSTAPSTALTVASASSGDKTSAAASVVIPPLPAVDDEVAAKLSKTQQKKLGLGPEGRTDKKGGFQQEGTHINREVLNQAKERESGAKLLKSEPVPTTKVESVPMDTPASSSSSSSSSSSYEPLAASQASDPVSGSINGQPEFGPVLNNPRSCYCCKARFYQLHFFYSEFCGPCARLNYAKRNQLADLRGKVVLLTGSRVKIGFRCGLRLLRCGATLIATSRFPHDTAKRYAEEKDFNVWRSRLHIYGLDLRDLKSVVKLADILSDRYDRLDAIINNAAQTVRRPPMYYRHLLPIECLKPSELPKDWKEVVKGDLHELAGRARLAEEGKQARLEANETGIGSKSSVTVEDISHVISEAMTPNGNVEQVIEKITSDNKVEKDVATTAAAAAPTALSSSSSATVTDAPPSPSPSPSPSHMDVFHPSEDINAALLTTSNRAAALSQLTVLPGDQHQDSALFPENRFDVTGQQLDLRKVNSWNLTLDQVDPSELVEVFAINALSPFILNSRLKGLMLKGGRHPQLGIQVTDKYIINVSAMEGKFYRHKS